MNETRVQFKVVRDEDAADEVMRRLTDLKNNFFGSNLRSTFGFGVTYKGGVYVVYLTFASFGIMEKYLPHLRYDVERVLKDIDSAGVAACLGCRHRASCNINPNVCGYWL